MKIPDKLDLKKVDYKEISALAEQLGDVPKLSQDTGDDRIAEEVRILQKALILIANHYWRMSSAIIDKESGEIKEDLGSQELKKVGYSIDGMKEALESLGINIIDRIGEPFDAGFPDQVITEEPREGISKEQVTRTIRPTIIWRHTMVQRGEIDIAVPINHQ